MSYQPKRIPDEAPGTIYLPKLGLVAHEQIEHFTSENQYCWVQLRGKPRPHLLSNNLTCYARRLPHFVRQGARNTKQKLVNPLNVNS